MPEQRAEMMKLMGALFKPHPWHGITSGTQAPSVVSCYIEIVPADTIKYEIEKRSGYLKVDRPQKFSSLCPTPYGFVPQTYCAENVGAWCSERTGRPGIAGDGDPMDICVLTEKDFTHGDFLLEAIPIGGLLMIDKNQADDKIIAVLRQDAVYGNWHDVNDVPAAVIERLRHYFLTYKDVPGLEPRAAEITHIYGRDEAHETIRRSQADYRRHFQHLCDALGEIFPR